MGGWDHLKKELASVTCGPTSSPSVHRYKAPPSLPPSSLPACFRPCPALQIHGEMKWFYTTAIAAAFLHLLLARAVIHRRPTATPSGWGLDDDEKMRLGSSPPSCYGRCSMCNPCLAVQVPTLPDHDDVGPGSVNSVATAVSSSSSSIGDPYSNYKPLEWKCQCRDRVFNP